MRRDEFDVLLVKHYEELNAWCRCLVRNEELAMDLSHDTIIKAIEACDDFVPHNMREWLFTIAKNCFINNIKRNAKMPCDELDEDTFDSGNISPAKPREGESTIRLYQEAVESLSPILRDVYLLRESGMSVIEVAEQLGIPAGTVKSRTFGASRNIRTYLERAMEV